MMKTMENAMKHLVSLAFVLIPITGASAGDYIKDGKLTHTLKIQQLQSGFAGVTGMGYTLEPDGDWTSVSIFNKKLKMDASGKLSPRELSALVGILDKNELSKLPAKIGKAPGANPYTLTLEVGKTKIEYIGRVAPRIDEANPTSPESRLALIWQGFMGAINSSKGKAEK